MAASTPISGHVFDKPIRYMAATFAELVFKRFVESSPQATARARQRVHMLIFTEDEHDSLKNMANLVRVKTPGDDPGSVHLRKTAQFCYDILNSEEMTPVEPGGFYQIVTNDIGRNRLVRFLCEVAHGERTPEQERTVQEKAEMEAALKTKEALEDENRWLKEQEERWCAQEGIAEQIKAKADAQERAFHATKIQAFEDGVSIGRRKADDAWRDRLARQNEERNDRAFQAGVEAERQRRERLEEERQDQLERERLERQGRGRRGYQRRADHSRSPYC